MKTWVRFLAAAGVLALLSGCTNVEIQFTRAERINLSEEKSAGRPLELAIVAVTKSDLARKPDLASITSYDWFKTAESDRGGAPFGIPEDQIWYYADSKKPYGKNRVGDALPGRDESGKAIPSAKFNFPREATAKESVIYVFARYQDPQNALKSTPAVKIDNLVNRKNPTIIYVGPMELRRDK